MKDRRFTLLLDPEESLFLKRLALEDHRSQSAYLRLLLWLEIEKKLKDPNQNQAFPQIDEENA